jgi:hypothetical protein
MPTHLTAPMDQWGRARLSDDSRAVTAANRTGRCRVAGQAPYPENETAAPPGLINLLANESARGQMTRVPVRISSRAISECGTYSLSRRVSGTPRLRKILEADWIEIVVGQREAEAPRGR